MMPSGISKRCAARMASMPSMLTRARPGGDTLLLRDGLRCRDLTTSEPRRDGRGVIRNGSTWTADAAAAVAAGREGDCRDWIRQGRGGQDYARGQPGDRDGEDGAEGGAGGCGHLRAECAADDGRNHAAARDWGQ